MRSLLKVCNSKDNDRIVRVIKNKMGFGFYSKMLNENINNNDVISSINTVLEEDIKNTFNVALYYAIDLGDKNIEKEIFGTDKYKEQLVKYMEQSDENMIKVKDYIDKYKA